LAWRGIIAEEVAKAEEAGEVEEVRELEEVKQRPVAHVRDLVRMHRTGFTRHGFPTSVARPAKESLRLRSPAGSGR